MAKEKEAKYILRKYLSRKYTNAQIVDELVVCNGKNRVDVVVIDKILWGFEIKTSEDNLKRLKQQIEGYSKVFDKITLVIASKHLNSLEKVNIPENIGVMVFTEYKNGKLKSVKSIKKTKVNKNIVTTDLCHFLWRDEAYNILKRNNLNRGYSNSDVSEIRNTLIRSFKQTELKAMVTQTLKNRFYWLNHYKHIQCDD